MSSKDIESWKPFTTEQWIAWLSATMVAAVTIVVFLFTQFQTKDAFISYRDGEAQSYEHLEKRLDRL